MKLIKISVGVFALTLACVCAAAAQTPSQTPSKAKAKPLATPPPSISGAEIISRAEDYVEKPIVPKAEEKPAEKPAANVNELSERIKKLEAGQASTYDEKQKRLLLNLDILTRAEQRSESLRKQHFEMIEKENALRSRIDQIEVESRPEMIERSVQIAGTLRPEDVRDAKKKSLFAEKSNIQALLTEVQSTRANLATSLLKADQMVEKLRTKLEKDIDESFLKDDPPQFRDPENN